MADYATLLRDHVTLTCRSVDRIFRRPTCRSCSAWAGCASSCTGRGGSGSRPRRRSEMATPTSPRYTGGPKRTASLRRFAKGENKEQIARPLIEAAEREGGDGRVVLIGIAQERPRWAVLEGQGPGARCASAHGGRQMAFVNHFSFLVRHEAPCRIPDSVRRNLEEHSWV